MRRAVNTQTFLSQCFILTPFAFSSPGQNHESKLKHFEGAYLGKNYLPFHLAALLPEP